MFESYRTKYGALCLIIAGLWPPSSKVEQPGAIPALSSTSQIAFASHRDGNWEIYVMDADGGHQTRLTRRDSQDRFPLWSPDRSKIAFGSQVGGTHWELWVMNADGSNPRQLASDIVAKDFRQWSHDGTRIVFAAAVARDLEIFSVDVDNGRLIRLTAATGDDRDPSWSPDDRQIVFCSTRDGNAEIYVMGADGSNPRRLTTHAALDGSPAWSPDGSRIAFVSTRDGEGDVYLIRSNDRGLERLTVGAHVTKDMSRWSPNGAYIAIQSANDGNYDIALVQMSDRRRTVVAGTRAFDGQYSWASEGDRLAFISHRDSVDAVYVTDLSGSQQHRLTSTASLNPAWSP